MSKTNVICAVPVRNEAWIIKDLILSAQKWADLILIVDHNSTDQTGSIARAFEKVKVIPCKDNSLDRGTRRKLLIDEARKIPGRRLIFTLDADEMISANWNDSSEWDTMLNAEPGTRFDFDWVELFPGLKECDVFRQSAAFMDDDTEYTNRGTEIHESRVPDAHGEIIKLNDIKLLHYIFLDLESMFSKHRWYKCLEYLERGERPWALSVMYQDSRIKSYDAPILPVRAEWIKGYDWLEQYRSLTTVKEKCYWYDEAVLDYFDKYGVQRFRKLNIWEVDWNQKAEKLGRTGNYHDPRSYFEKWIHKFIERYRENLNLRKDLKWKIIYRLGSVALKPFGW